MFKPFLTSLGSFIVVTALVLISSGVSMADDVPPIIDETDEIGIFDNSTNYTRSADSVDTGSDTKYSIVQESIAKDSIPKESVIKESIAIDSIPKENIVQDSNARESIVKDSVAIDSTTKENIVQNSNARESIVKDNTAKDSIVKDSIAIDSIPKNSVIKESVSKDSSKDNQPKRVASSSTWRNFTSMIGVSDNRPVIPPVEIKHPETVSNQAYVVGPGDQLGISVWRDDSLTRTVVVLHDGKIHYPLLGEIVAGGKTIAQLRNEFKEKLSDYVIDADITVEVRQSNSMLIYLIGKVNSPGRQMLSAETTVLQALAIAGGLNPYAEKDDIKIFRQEKGRTIVYSFRYSQVTNGEQLNDNIILKRGDVIVVP